MGEKEEVRNLEDWIKSVDKKLDNHITHIVGDMTQVKLDMSQMRTNLEWVLKFFWLLAGVSITAIVSAVLGLVLKK